MALPVKLRSFQQDRLNCLPGFLLKKIPQRHRISGIAAVAEYGGIDNYSRSQSFVAFSSFFMIEKMKTAEMTQRAMRMLHSTQRGRPPQSMPMMETM